MPYKNHESLESPNDNEIVWRYFSKFKYFEEQISKKMLSFTRDKFFTDPNEGRFTRKYEQNFSPEYHSTTVSSSICGPTIVPMFSPGNEKQNINEYQDKIREMYIVNCWTLKNSESIHMWVRYTGLNEKKITTNRYCGIAIQTTFARLKECFDEEVSDMFISKISYDDYENDDFMKKKGFFTHLPLIHKMDVYHDESELRVFTVDVSTPNERVDIKVDFRKLIEKIVITPSPEDDLQSKIQNLLTENSLDGIPVGKSKIDLPHAFA